MRGLHMHCVRLRYNAIKHAAGGCLPSALRPDDSPVRGLQEHHEQAHVPGVFNKPALCRRQGRHAVALGTAAAPATMEPVLCRMVRLRLCPQFSACGGTMRHRAADAWCALHTQQLNVSIGEGACAAHLRLRSNACLRTHTQWRMQRLRATGHSRAPAQAATRELALASLLT